MYMIFSGLVSIFFSFLLMLFSLFFFKFSMYFTWKIFCFGSISFEICFLLDWVSLMFFSVLLIMFGSVSIFSFFYMSDEIKVLRFFIILSLFVFSMVLLIFMPNIFLILLGWDGLGLTSFLLICYYNNYYGWSASLKTYLTNRLGDSFFMIGMGFCVLEGHWGFTSLGLDSKFLMFLFLFFSFLTKSAQYPFSSWLPAAMAAPTPVSSLVHSSTLVTAGLYLYIRFFYILPYSLLLAGSFVGLFTLWFGSLAACVDYDIKKVVAYSTLSQLGIIMFISSIGYNLLSFFHLLSHACFKALLFICVGFIILQYSHMQDLRSIGNTSKFSPFLKVSLIFSGLSLSGFPFLAGFYSKEVLFDGSFFGIMNFPVFIMFVLSLPFTLFYFMRLFSFLSLENKALPYVGVVGAPLSIFYICLGALTTYSVILGSFLNYVFYFSFLFFVPFFFKSLIFPFFLFFFIFLCYLFNHLGSVFLSFYKSLLYLHYLSSSFFNFYSMWMISNVFFSLESFVVSDMKGMFSRRFLFVSLYGNVLHLLNVLKIFWLVGLFSLCFMFLFMM